MRTTNKMQSNKYHMKAEIKDGKLLVEIDLEPKPTPSASGKTLVIASTHGNAKTEAIVQGKQVIIGLNAYIKRDGQFE